MNLTPICKNEFRKVLLLILVICQNDFRKLLQDFHLQGWILQIFLETLKFFNIKVDKMDAP